MIELRASVVVCLILISAAFGAGPSAKGEPKVNPDLTKEVWLEKKNDYLLGPTGLRGWMFVKTGRQGPQDMSSHYSTAEARQILVTKVEEKSPADGVLAVGDVILGIGDTPFDSDPRKVLAAAIDEAEKVENKGVLKLLRWRPDKLDEEGKTERSPGKKETVSLTLKTLGAYAETAPYDCPKSKALLKQTIDALYREKMKCKLKIPMLALLATGEEKHVERARGIIKGAGKQDLKLGVDGHCWNWSYTTILLCEYYLMTGDESVLHAIKEYTVAISKGQSISGTWGHRTASPKWNDGKLHGRLEGYADLNQPSLTCYLALELGRKCGVEDPELTQALKKCRTYFRYYVDKGGVPYGYHPPKEYMLTDNGTSATAALTFALNGDTRAVEFFSRMCAASHGKLDVGHTGIFFNLMWTALGVNLGGPELCAAYYKRWRWYTTLCRKWDGGFSYQQPGGGNKSYRGLSMTAAMALHYSMPGRKLHITGRDQDKSLWLDRDEAQAIVEAWDIEYSKASDEKLIELLGHEIPLVRRQAASELAKRDGDFVPKLKELLVGSRHQRVGACRALSAMKEKSAPVAGDLMTIVADPKHEQWVRICAVGALAACGDAVRKHLPALLKLALAEKPEDGRGRLDIALGEAIRRLAKRPYHETLDKNVLYKVAMKLLKHPHAMGRYQGAELIRQIPIEDFHIFADEIVHVIVNKDKSYVTYHSDHARKVGLIILEQLNIEEGIELCMNTIHGGWGTYWRLKGPYGRLEMIKKYGASAKPYLPKLKALPWGKNPPVDVFKAIEESKVERKLISLEDAKKIGASRSKE